MKRIYCIIILCCIYSFSYADKGLWLPCLDSTLYANLKEQGLQMLKDELCNDDGYSLRDAVVRFGNGCTGVIVSDRGLLLTNYHCVSRYMQQIAKSGCDYELNGYWAEREGKGELPIKGLSIRLLVKMKDVTDYINEGKNLLLKEKQDSLVQIRISQLKCKYAQKELRYEAKIHPMYAGNKYYLFLYQVFDDIRLVGIPPSSIGQFGMEEDNWEWPRYTGDFAVLRIYANKENLPASYSIENVPYHPNRFATMSIRPIHENDFVMLMGYPGMTDQYITSFELDSMINISYPLRISLMDSYLNIMNKYMKNSCALESSYKALYSSINNDIKRRKYQIEAAKLSNLIDLKMNQENDINEIIENDAKLSKTYVNLLPQMFDLNNKIYKYSMPYDFYRSGFIFIKLFNDIRKLKSVDNKEQRYSLINQFIDQCNDTVIWADKEYFIFLMNKYYQEVPQEFHFSTLNMNADSVDYWISNLYSNSIFTSRERLKCILIDENENWQQDPAVCLLKEIEEMFNKRVWPYLSDVYKQMENLKREYVNLHIMLNPKGEWVDADGTMRLSYGKIRGYTIGSVKYPYQSFMEAMIRKHETLGLSYTLPERFLNLYNQKSFAEYDQNGRMPFCFISDCHTVGGNSGSPVFNAYGELIGLNFDRNKEGTISDMFYNPSLCRNIVVDSRYILFVIQQYAGANYLINELLLRK